MNKSLMKFTSILAAGLVLASSMNAFAATTVMSTKASSFSWVIQNGKDALSGRIFSSSDAITSPKAISLTWLQNAKDALSGKIATLADPTVSCVVCGGDADRYKVSTTVSPSNINDNKYTFGKIAIGTGNPGDSVLKVVGNIVFGDNSNRASVATNFSSVLWGLWNHVETKNASIAGWYTNNIVADGDESFIGGGWYNTIHSRASVIWWGEYNTINNGYATAYATIAWGRNNAINGELSTIWWGGYHSITNSFATIAWGVQNGVNGNFGTVGGGTSNVVSSRAGTIAWGTMNSITNLGAVSAILGGTENWISNANSAIAGGYKNIIHGLSSFLWGGEENIIEWGTMSFLWGGRYNTIKEGDWNVLVWGTKNFVKGFWSAVLGGEQNIVSASYSSIMWGNKNNINGNYSAIPWGQDNIVVWDYAFAWGRGAKALHDYSFVRNGDTAYDLSNPICQDPMAQLSCDLWLNDCPAQCLISSSFASTTDHQFIIHASHGVGINTNNTIGAALVVSGAIVWSYRAPSGNDGLTQIIHLIDSQSQPCTMNIEAGIITSTTCQ